MRLWRKREDGPPVRVGISIHAILGTRYVSLHEEAELPAGSAVRDLISLLRVTGKLDEEAYNVVAGVRPPITLFVNGENVNRRGRDKTLLTSGDVVTILTPTSGG